MIKNSFSLTKKILVSDCDSYGIETIPQVFTDFMNLASLQGEEENYGIKKMNEENLFWLTTKTRYHFYLLPKLLDEVTLSTWSNTPNGKRCYKEYLLKKDGETLVTGKTEWALFDSKLNQTIEVKRILPPTFKTNDDTSSIDFREFYDFTKGEVIGDYKCNQNDIDIGRHMNNVSYIKALLSLYSSKTWHDLKVNDIEIHYLKPCLEGETITFIKNDNASTSYIKGIVKGKEVCRIILERA